MLLYASILMTFSPGAHVRAGWNGVDIASVEAMESCAEEMPSEFTAWMQQAITEKRQHDREMDITCLEKQCWE